MKLKKIGILDPEGKNLNPLTNESYSSSYKWWAIDHPQAAWSKLPMYTRYSPEKLIKEIMENRVVIIEAGTGNGKSVLVPRYCLHALDYKGKVVMTNPKKIPTKSGAEFAAQGLDVEIGEEVGYQYQGSKLKNKKPSKTEETKLLYSTDGSVVQVLRNDPSGRVYDIVIIDEAHERNLRIDVILFQMKTALKLNKNLKLIVMSATLPKGLFQNYYKEFNPKYIYLEAIPNKPVENHYLKTPLKDTKDIGEKAIDLMIEKIIKPKKEGDVIIFVNSLNDADGACKYLNKKSKTLGEKIFCIPIAGGEGNKKNEELAKDKDKFREEPGGPWNRKVVIGTNVLESSITINGAIFVIDSGVELSSKYDPVRMERTLRKQNISLAQAIQRRGRVGRTKPGVCYMMYTKEQEKNFEKDPTVDIKKTDVTGEIILELFNFKETLEEVLELLKEFIEVPPPEFIETSIKVLYYLKIVDKETGKLTPLGEKVLKLNKITSYNVQMGCVLANSFNYNLEFEITSLLALFSSKPEKLSIKEFIFLDQKYSKFKSKEYKEIINKNNVYKDDLKTFLVTFLIFNRKAGRITKEGLEKYCEENCLSFRNLKKVRDETFKMFREVVQFTNFKEQTKTYNIDKNLNICILSGYYINLAKKIDNKTYKNWFPKKVSKANIDQNSLLKSGGNFVNIFRFIFSSFRKKKFD